MFLELLGFILTSFICAIIISIKFTSDIYPFALKKILNHFAIQNWIKHQPQLFNTNLTSSDPKCTNDLGIFVSQDERKIENTLELLHQDEHDDLMFYGIDDKGNLLVAQITRLYGGKVDCLLYIIINGIKYSILRQNISSTSYEFSCGNFKFEQIEPMRAWRVWYNGILNKEDNNGGLVHATINFLWKAIENPTDSTKDVNINLLSNYLSQNGSFGENLTELRNILPKGYSQFGTLHGIIKIDDDIEMLPLYLYGFRTRRFFSCSSSSSKSKPNRLELFGMCGTDGNAFKLEAMNNGWIDGAMYYASYQVNPILNVSEEPCSYLTDHTLPKLFNLNDKVKAFRIEIWPKVITHKFPSGLLEVTSLKLNMNGKEGMGFLVRRKFESYHHHCQRLYDLSNPRESISFTVPPLQVHVSKTTTEAVHFDSNLCLNVSLVGGKGASLAKLARIVKSRKDVDEVEVEKFQTAKGFCLTTSLFSSTLNIEKIKNIFLTAAATMNTEISLEQACSEVMNLIKSSKAKEKINLIIEPFLKEQFGNESNSRHLRYAVRSSGVLEDAEDLSCAGQNETFLGVTQELIAEKVIDCWASLFTSQSVHYRLNHGQPAMSEMGVVIQEMIDAQAAGVIFSADPRTGNPFEMIINANFGLGESVVSATCDPDNITIIRPRTNHHHEYNNNNNNNQRKKISEFFTIGKKTLGEKKIKIELSKDGDSTEEIYVNENETKNYCINDDVCIRLGKIVAKIEQELGDLKPIDVEWAIHKDGTIYILQSRNITALDSWTDFEIIHEMDNALRTNFEINTIANTGEVMPGASSPLTISVMIHMLDIAIQTMLHGRNSPQITQCAIRSLCIARQKILLNVINLFHKSNDKEIDPAKIATDLAIFGHRITTDKIHQMGVERHGIQSSVNKITLLAGAAKNVWKAQRDILRVEKKYENYKIDLNNIGNDSRSIYENLTKKIFDLYDIVRAHSLMSEASTITQMFAFLTLTQGIHVDNWDSELYEDVSKIFGVCTDVESADVPGAMDELASVIIADEGSLEDFTGKSPPEALKWLRLKNTLNTALDKFFGKHGHRCIAELDLSRKSWKADPIPFIQLLQSIVKNKMKAKETWKSSIKKSKYKNDDELLNSLKTKLSSGSKKFLKFILFYCRNSVRNREKTKSILVWTLDQIKPIYEKLARLMREEHLIPDEKLITFMTHQEIELIICGHKSTSRILFKALRRLRLYPELNKEQFPEISFGMIEPINQNIPMELGDSIQATPLNSGKVQATVKVCMNVEEAAQLIEPGDILVTIGTDIGWSPFFPLLGGIVTELGGLISHGAVVAREYGLPCIVGATNATKIFKSGEHAVLDAGKGTLTKVKL